MRNTALYEGSIRIRVCGVLVEEDQILLVQIHSPITHSLVWLPPGGQLEFGETTEECLKREFLEETDLKIEVKSLQYINELIEPPFHAVELFYSVQKSSGTAGLGKDPERPDEDQLLKDLQWIPLNKLTEISFVPQELVPVILKSAQTL